MIGFTTYICFERKKQGTQCWGEYKAAQFRGRWDLPDMDMHMLVLWSRFYGATLNINRPSVILYVYENQSMSVHGPSNCLNNLLSLPELCEMRWQSILFFNFLIIF